MHNYISLFIILFFSVALNAQSWTYDPIPNLPIKTSNNATSVYSDATGRPKIYSFSGIDETKVFSGIHARSFCLDVFNQSWTELAALPSGGPRIAAGASRVKNLIYIIGGYRVLSNDNEESLNNVHCFDPAADTFRADRTPIPIAIDDHIQAVWRDSLIYVVTGWSNTANVPNVQIYNPGTDQWTSGTPVPNNALFTAFGASGTIIGDTIYYAGGARGGTNFPAALVLRKGIINPNNPLEINWTNVNTVSAAGYRMGCSQLDNQVLWIGGSNVTYNYDGVAYNGSGIVSANRRATLYSTKQNDFTQYTDGLPPIMDLRGLVKLNDRQWVTIGGMYNKAEVTDSCFVYRLDSFSKTSNYIIKDKSPIIFPNPSHHEFFIKGNDQLSGVIIYDQNGKLAFKTSQLKNDLSFYLPNGTFIAKINYVSGEQRTQKILSLHNE